MTLELNRTRWEFNLKVCEKLSKSFPIDEKKFIDEKGFTEKEWIIFFINWIFKNVTQHVQINMEATYNYTNEYYGVKITLRSFETMIKRILNSYITKLTEKQCFPKIQPKVSKKTTQHTNVYKLLLTEDSMTSMLIIPKKTYATYIQKEDELFDKFQAYIESSSDSKSWDFHSCRSTN